MVFFLVWFGLVCSWSLVWFCHTSRAARCTFLPLRCIKSTVLGKEACNGLLESSCRKIFWSTRVASPNFRFFSPLHPNFVWSELFLIRMLPSEARYDEVLTRSFIFKIFSADRVETKVGNVYKDQNFYNYAKFLYSR